MKNNKIFIFILICTCFLCEQVKARTNVCTYHFATSEVISSGAKVGESNTFPVRCDIDTSKNGVGTPESSIYCYTQYKDPSTDNNLFGESLKIAKSTSAKAADQYFITPPENFIQASIGNSYAYEDGTIYKNFIEENYRCPKYILLQLTNKLDNGKYSNVSSVFADDKEDVKAAWAGGRDCGKTSCTDNVMATYVLWGATNFDSLNGIIQYQQDINDSDASKNEVPDYVTEDENNPSKEKVKLVCGLFGEKTFGYIKLVWNIIKYAAPVLVIILGMLDFAKVVLSGEEKDMKVAGQRFIKRIIAAVVIILLPVLLRFIFSIVGFSEGCLQHLL